MFTLEHLASVVDGAAHGNAQHLVSNLSSLARAGAADIVYFDNPLLKSVLESTNAGIVLLKQDCLDWCPVNAIVVAEPLSAIRKIASLFEKTAVNSPTVDETAQIHPSVRIGNNVTIGPYAILNEHVLLGDGVCIGAHSIIGASVRIGENSRIGCNAILHKNTQIGQSVSIHSGCILGASPFNFLKEHGAWKQGFTLGGVTLADKVSIGANTVIDHGSIGDTYIAQGVCIDNLVHLAHDVYIGAHTVIAGCATVGAHTVIGADCIIGGASCIAAYVQLTENVVISGMTTVSKSISKPGIYSSGTLAHEHRRWRRNAARFRRLDDYVTKLSALERKMLSGE